MKKMIEVIDKMIEITFTKKSGRGPKSITKTMGIPEKHQLNVALKTLKMHDVGASIMGGMTKEEARGFLRTTGWTEGEIRKYEKTGRR